jgi:hypothetical protein
MIKPRLLMQPGFSFGSFVPEATILTEWDDVAIIGSRCLPNYRIAPECQSRRKTPFVKGSATPLTVAASSFSVLAAIVDNDIAAIRAAQKSAGNNCAPPIDGTSALPKVDSIIVIVRKLSGDARLSPHLRPLKKP